MGKPRFKRDRRPVPANVRGGKVSDVLVCLRTTGTPPFLHLFETVLVTPGGPDPGYLVPKTRGVFQGKSPNFAVYKDGVQDDSWTITIQNLGAHQISSDTAPAGDYLVVIEPFWDIMSSREGIPCAGGAWWITVV
jgi:hypothetical protein